MKIIPAIDILDGKCVRLLKGDYAKVTEYNNDPLAQVQIFKNSGFKSIHIVDLNAAKTGGNENLTIIKKISNEVDIDIQVGGGIRSLNKAKELLSCNVKKVIVGTAAITDSNFRNELKENINSDELIFGLDFNIIDDNPLLSVNGWTNNTNINLFDYIDDHSWIKNVLATDISVDGTLNGPNLTVYKNLLQNTHINLIASGGIGSMDDIYSLKSIFCNECVVGKAIYENKISLKDLLNAN
jgi:phosphoribosylformimino-5-aminoimidazole carboxamide ribotide isomerase